MNWQLQKAETPDEVYQMTANSNTEASCNGCSGLPSAGRSLLDGIVYPADGSSPHSVTKEKQEQGCDPLGLAKPTACRSDNRNIRKGKAIVSCYSYRTKRFTASSEFRWRSKRSRIAFTSGILFSILGECALALKKVCTTPKKRKAAVLARTNSFAPTSCAPFPRFYERR